MKRKSGRKRKASTKKRKRAEKSGSDTIPATPFAKSHLRREEQRQIIRRASPMLGHTPSTAGTFRKKFRKNSRKTPETLSERILEFPSRVRLGCPKPYNSMNLRLPEHFQTDYPKGESDAIVLHYRLMVAGKPQPRLVMMGSASHTKRFKAY